MATIGAFEAKTHFSALLERVAQGEEMVITRHGRPVARLMPAARVADERVGRAIDQLKALRQGISLKGLCWRALRAKGRR